MIKTIYNKVVRAKMLPIPAINVPIMFKNCRISCNISIMCIVLILSLLMYDYLICMRHETFMFFYYVISYII